MIWNSNHRKIATHLKLADVAVLHHDGEESDDHLRARPEEMELVKKGHSSQLEVLVSPQHNLPLAPLLSIVDAAQSVCQRVHPHHGGSGLLLSESYDYDKL